MSMTTDYAHEHTITAFFDTRGAAEKAKADVIAAGVPADRVRVIDGGNSTTRTSAAADEPGFWQSLKDLFVPEEDRHTYAEGLGRGGYLVSAEVSAAQHERVLDVLDADGAVNMDEREAQWRSEGWSGTAAAVPATGLGGALTRQTASGAGRDSYADETAARNASSTGRASGATGVAPASAGLASRTEAAIGDAATGTEEVIPVAEERLRVGKRDVSHGRVRLRSYVVEQAVQDAVQLHSEHVDVSRRPVDRAAAPGETLFQERVIEAEERAEEAVVSKEARVVEEVRLNRVAQDRTQEISDTVRRTQVEIDDGRANLGNDVAGAASNRNAIATDRIVEHMPVFAADGEPIGTVDRLEGDRIKLAKHDAPDGQHHYLPLSWVGRVADAVHLDRKPDAVRAGWSAV